MNRKQRRAMESEMGKETTQKITSSLDLMMTLEKCCVCDAPFDRKSKEQVTTWSVEVFKADKRVNLYCPECYTVKQQVAY
jgi:hypothetical protein